MTICPICIHSDACQAWIRHGTTLYNDFEYFTENCPYFRNAKQNELISKGVYEQVRWERDIAISQLESYGVDLGQKADVVKVVRCKNCKSWKCLREDRGLCKHPTFTLDDDAIDPLTEPNDFCSYGERKDDAQ